MRTRLIANFQGTRDRPPAMGDLHRIKQQPGETLQKYIQRFNNARIKIPKVTDEAIISAFSDGVRDVKMKEVLAIHEELCMTLELFNIATKCARAEEGRLSLLELPAVDPEDKKTKAKDVKHKGAVVLASEPDTKGSGDQPESPTILRLPQPAYPQHQRLLRAQSHLGRMLWSTPRAWRPGLRSRRRAWWRTLGRPWPAPGMARPAS